MEFNVFMLVVVEKAIYQVQSLKQNYSQTKTSHLSVESKLRSMCENFMCYSLNVFHAS